MQWWVIWANNQPIKGIGVTANVFYGTQAQAEATASRIVDGTVTGPYSTKQDAQAAISAAGGNPAHANTPVTNPPPGPQQPGIRNPLTGLAAIGDFFNKLSDPQMWLRVAEVLLGAGLIIVALAKLAGDTPVGRAATKVATKVAFL